MNEKDLDVRLQKAVQEAELAANPLISDTERLVLSQYSSDEDDLYDRAQLEHGTFARPSPRVIQKSRLPHFDRLLLLGGLDEPRLVSEDSAGWELWTVHEPPRLFGSAKNLRMVVLLEPATDDRLRAVEADVIARWQRQPQPSFILGPKLERDRVRVEEQIQSVFHNAEVVTRRDVLLRFLPNIQKRARHADAEHWFIDPFVDSEGREHHSAMAALTGFLHHQGDGAALGVLVGGAGAGKTTLARQLGAVNIANTLKGGRGDTGPISTFVVTDEVWRGLEQRRIPITIDSVLKECLRVHGFTRDDLEQLDVLLSNGGSTLVFDGFDEVCSRGPRTSPNDVLKRMLSLVEIENSQARVLLTSRPEFWEHVDPSVRAKCVTFTSRLFDTKHIDAYVDRRFADHEAGTKQRVRALLAELPEEIRSLPAVVAIVCDAFAGGTELAGWLAARGAGIRRENPLGDIARAMFEREAERQDYPLDANLQVRFFTVLAAEYGHHYSERDVREVGEVVFQLSRTQAANLTRHFMFSREGEELTVGYPELADAVRADSVASMLTRLGRGMLTDHHEWTLLRQMLVRAHSDLPGLVERVATLMAAMPIAEQTLVWEHRKELHGYPEAQTSLFNLLLGLQKAGDSGLRQPAFLGFDGAVRVAADFEFVGSLTNADLRAVRFVRVQFRDAEIAACVFSSISEFWQCAFISTRIGRDCKGLTPDAMLHATYDDVTAGLSRHWVQFAEMNPAGLARVALKRIVSHLLESPTDTAFALSAVLVEDELEEHVLDELRRRHVIVDNPIPAIQGKHLRDAKSLVWEGKVVGDFQHVFREVAAWTSRYWGHG